MDAEPMEISNGSSNGQSEMKSHSGNFNKKLSTMTVKPKAKTPKAKTRSVIRTSKDERPLKLQASNISYFEKKIIGSGASCTVYYGYFEDPKRKAAVKAVDAKFYKLYLNEVEILRRNLHPNVVQYFATDSNLSSSVHYIAMELAITTFEDFMDKSTSNKVEFPHPTLEVTTSILRQALTGLCFLHRNRIIHRDIKPSNILLFMCDESINKFGLQAKLTDFGLSKDLTKLPQTSNSLAKGTCEWMSPEALIAFNDEVYYKADKLDDIFSMGSTFSFGWTDGIYPWGQKIHRMSNITKYEYCPASRQKLLALGHVYYHAVLTMLSKREGRPTAEDLLEHPCFWDGEKKLQFLQVVSNYLSGKTGTAPHDRQVIDYMFSDAVCGGNWTRSMCFDLTSFVLNHSPQHKNPKRYKLVSVVSLIEFIRDKNQHYTEWPNSLKHPSVFGSNDNTYGNYFGSLFPNLILFLFVFIQKRKSERKLMGFYQRNDSKYKIPLNWLLKCSINAVSQLESIKIGNNEVLEVQYRDLFVDYL